MNQSLNQLQAILDAEMDRYRDMRDLLARERSATSPSQHRQLESLGQEKQALIDDLRQLEKRRQAVAEALAGELGLSGGAITVSRIAKRLKAPQATRLTERAAALRSLIVAVQRENRNNSRLISHYLELSHASLRLINDLVAAHSIYHKPGCGKQGPGYGDGRGRIYCGSV